MEQDIKTLVDDINADSQVTAEEIFKLQRAVKNQGQRVAEAFGGDEGITALVESFEDTAQRLQENLVRAHKEGWDAERRSAFSNLLEVQIALLSVNLNGFSAPALAADKAD